MYLLQVYKHCAKLDTSGLKDPRLHANTKISALYNLGRMYAEMERYQEALETYKEALKRRPSHYAPQSIYNMMGMYHSDHPAPNPNLEKYVTSMNNESLH